MKKIITKVIMKNGDLRKFVNYDSACVWYDNIDPRDVVSVEETSWMTKDELCDLQLDAALKERNRRPDQQALTEKRVNYVLRAVMYILYNLHSSPNEKLTELISEGNKL